MDFKLNTSLYKGVKGRNALPHECKCNLDSVSLSCAEDELCERLGRTNDVKLAAQRNAGNGLVGDSLQDDL